ncbi:hypothetical protein JT358_03270 [Micrococcales bacterium 31B]|nr:hypothetical protein [Micrococcales bacterium 31B]
MPHPTAADAGNPTTRASWLPDATTWQSGDWSLEVRDDEIADLRHRGDLVLRSIRMVVRDHNWATPELLVDELTTNDQAVTLTVHSEGYGSSVEGVITVSVEPDGALTVDWRGRSREEYLTNRTGLVVLHPPTLAGTELTVLHDDGTRDALVFPDTISPHQPVVSIRELSWETGGRTVHVAFAGEVFEMEDQRNWTDASYKTYCRPLELPFPYLLQPGEALAQSVTVRVSGTPNAPSLAATPACHTLRLLDSGRFPDITTSVGPFDIPSAPEIADAPWLASSDTLLIEPNLALPGWVDLVRAAVASGKALDVRLVLPEEPESHDAADGLGATNEAALDACVAELKPARLVRIAVFSPHTHTTRPGPTAALRESLSRFGIETRVLGGARSHFTELNREHAALPGRSDDPDDLPTEGIVFSMTPLFHALHTHQVVESVAMHAVVARDAVAIAGEQPVHVGPVTLRSRFNNVSTDAGSEPEAPPSDPRQTAPELAAWIVASVAAIARPGVESISYFEAFGPRGLGSFEGEAAGPTPAAAAFAALSAVSGCPLWRLDANPGDTGHPVWAVGATTANGVVVFLANLADEASEISVQLASGERTGPVALEPWGWARVTMRAPGLHD